jgi:dihydroorotase
VVFAADQPANTATTVSRSTNSPYLGLDLTGAVLHTVFRGNLTVRDGALTLAAGAMG